MIMMLICLAGSVATSFLPETLGAKLPETLEARLKNIDLISHLALPISSPKQKIEEELMKMMAIG